MSQDPSAWMRQMRGWAGLKGLHAAPIDLERLALIRSASREDLADPRWLAALLLRLGLNDEALNEFPAELHPHCGHGLRLWQYPVQFSPYLAQLVRLGVRSYLEIGIRHGGSFTVTVEYLQRFKRLDFAVGVDIIPCPSMPAYEARNPVAQFWCVNTRAPDFVARLDRLGPIDLVFIDSHHEEDQCRSEFALLAARAGAVAFHDVSNIGCPGVQRVWQEVKSLPGYDRFEYTQQYSGLGPFMGIGLAVKREWPWAGKLGERR